MRDVILFTHHGSLPMVIAPDSRSLTTPRASLEGKAPGNAGNPADVLNFFVLLRRRRVSGNGILDQDGYLVKRGEMGLRICGEESTRFAFSGAGGCLLQC
jgi:hypothetical protein